MPAVISITTRRSPWTSKGARTVSGWAKTSPIAKPAPDSFSLGTVEADGAAAVAEAKRHPGQVAVRSCHDDTAWNESGEGDHFDRNG